MKNRIWSIFAVLLSMLSLRLYGQGEPDFVPPDPDDGHNGIAIGPINESMLWLVLAAVILGVAFLYYRRQRIGRA